MSTPPHTPARLKSDLAALGLEAGQTVMMHGSFKSLGGLMGGPNTVIDSLLDVLGEQGTLMMYVGWNDMPDFYDIPPDEQPLYRQHHPPFDPLTARAVRDHGILADCLRTWPNVRRSLNPEASMAAVGRQADEITRDHPLNFGYGLGTPLHRLSEWGGKVLILGSPVSTVTLLHHAEALANMRHKNLVRHHCPILRDGKTVWVEMDDFDTSEPHGAYSFRQIMTDYLVTGAGQRGKVCDATSYLFDAPDVVRFATTWLEERF